MSKKLPAPPIEAHVDLRDYRYMYLDVHRLLDSDLMCDSSAEGVRGALLLWCKAWHQVPAGSLPDNRKRLMMWADINPYDDHAEVILDEALRHFTKCSDGRLYHPVVCEQAERAWEGLQKVHKRAHAGARKRWENKRKLDNAQAVPEQSLSNANAMPEQSLGNAQAMLREEKNREENQSPLTPLTDGVGLTESDVMKAFRDSVKTAFGDEVLVSPTDVDAGHIIARWATAGVSLDTVRRVFTTQQQRKADLGQKPIRALRYFADAMLDAQRQIDKPPPANSNQPGIDRAETEHKHHIGQVMWGKAHPRSQADVEEATKAREAIKTPTDWPKMLPVRKRGTG